MELKKTEKSTLIRHRQPADRMLLEPKMLSSVVVGGSLEVTGSVEPLSVVGSLELLLVVGGCGVGGVLMLKVRDWAPQSFRVNTMVRFSPVGRHEKKRVIFCTVKYEL